MTGLKWCIVGESLELHKQVYIFPNGDVVICHKKHHSEEVLRCECGVVKDCRLLELDKQVNIEEINSKYVNERVIVVNDLETINYYKHVLSCISIAGIDLEGNLKQDGFVYLVQIGTKNPQTHQNQTFVFDIFQLQKGDRSLLDSALLTIKYVM